MSNYGESNGDLNAHEKQLEGHDLGENGDGSGNGVILGIDGGTTSTVCVCIPFFPSSKTLPKPLPILGRAVSGCSNHNSVGETAARDTLEEVMAEALSKSGSNWSTVHAVCLGVSGVNHPTDQERILYWLREIFPSHVKLYVRNDAVAALASGTMGKLHGCVLIAGTGCISYGFAEDGREARASGAGPVLGDWGSGYGIAAKALTAVIRAHDGRGPQTMLTDKILKAIHLSSPEELIGWTYADPSWARIAALVPEVVSCAEACDQVATKILVDAVQDLALSVKAVVQRLSLCGEDGNGSFPVVMVGGVLEANRTWDIGEEVVKCIQDQFPGAHPIRPQVEPAVGAALLAWNFLMKESTENCHS
ncbi:ACTIN-LIKE ATPASE SUPERFAMILY PROTEIN [Salix koriyanagi]|uniref:N-acetyl-D-glucosamine kinase n=1 Tax=Salix koriyanagi TaxID=2511006 RepID=A0A9Q1AMT9_9ROSI|nr:ACTIN-LIKE ATPASE SUPERFAMILY PROTEIN [Salix koriyanagi]